MALKGLCIEFDFITKMVYCRKVNLGIEIHEYAVNFVRRKCEFDARIIYLENRKERLKRMLAKRIGLAKLRICPGKPKYFLLFFKLWVKCILVVYTRSRVGWECAFLNWFVTSLLCWEKFPPTRWREIKMNILQDSFSPLCDLIGSILTLSNCKRFDAFSFVFINCSSCEMLLSVRKRKPSNNPHIVIAKSITVPFCL